MELAEDSLVIRETPVANVVERGGRSEHPLPA